MNSATDRIRRKCDALICGYREYLATETDSLGVAERSDSEKNAAVSSDDSSDSRFDLIAANVRFYEYYLARLQRIGSELSADILSDQSTMGGAEAELDGMVGRLHIELQAVIGFARLGSGDVFEVSIRHGSQKWKSRGKTQSDRTQRWDSPEHFFTCYPDHPLTVKVTEVRMIKSKVLTERSFDPIKFFSPQPLLVTMNLNAIGSLKLKMVVSWLPLMTSKALPLRPLQNQRSITAPTLGRSAEQKSQNNSEIYSPPKVCLREKKKGRQSMGGDWRSSTAILDSVYKDLSKSIPTVDDLTAFGGDNYDLSSLNRQPKDSRPKQPQLGTRMFAETNRSLSMHHLAKPDFDVAKRPATSMTDSDDSSGVSSITGRAKPSQQVDRLLSVIDSLRESLSALRAAEYPELVSFEATMLNWEATLKLNRAVLLEQTRGITQRSSSANRLTKRSSLYSQHSPLSDQIDGIDQNFENDSGIDSLRQNVSPYNRNFGTANRCSGAGPAQRRFKQMKERRKSLGIVLDDEFDLSALSRIPPIQITATGHSELDAALEHHLVNSRAALEEIRQLNGPFQFRFSQSLSQIEQNTMALEEMHRIADSLPHFPHPNTLLNELGASADQQEIWLETSMALHSTIRVPSEHLRVNLVSFVSAIVRPRYPQLVNRVAESLMSQMKGPATPDYVTVFEFTTLFSGKQMNSFVENLAHESFITSSLESRKPSVVAEIMDRLRKVPIVPPLESVRQIALVLCDLPEAVPFVEKYLNSASDSLRLDLSSAFSGLLEHSDSGTRKAAARALAVLKMEQTAPMLKVIATEDENSTVRLEARRALSQIEQFADEITKI